MARSWPSIRTEPASGVTTAVRPDVWARSLDERLIDHEEGRDLDGCVWGIKWQEMYPGARLVSPSADAGRWGQELGVPFHEASIDANAHHIDLVFSDLSIRRVSPGYAPFTVPDSGPE